MDEWYSGLVVLVISFTFFTMLVWKFVKYNNEMVDEENHSSKKSYKNCLSYSLQESSKN